MNESNRRLLPAFVLLFILLLALPVHGANPSYQSFRGINGISISSNPPNGLIIFDGSGVVSSGTNSSIRSSVNGTNVTSGATNLDLVAGRNISLSGTNIGSTSHIGIDLNSKIYLQAADFTGTVDVNNITVTNGIIYLAGATNSTNGYVLTSDDSGSATWRPPTGAGTNIPISQALYLDAFGNDSTAGRTNLLRQFLTASNAFRSILSGDTLVVRGGTNMVKPLPAESVGRNSRASLIVSNKNNIRITGEPGSVFQLESLYSINGTNFSGTMMSFDRCTNVLIEGITLRGIRILSNVAQHCAVLLTNCENVTFDGVKILDWQNQGVSDLSYDVANKNISFRNCVLQNIGGTNASIGTGSGRYDGAAISVNCDNLIVERCLFGGNLRSVEHCCAAVVSGLRVENSYFLGDLWQSILLEAASVSDVQIVNNRAYGVTTGLPNGVTESFFIYTAGISNALISGNIVGKMSTLVWSGGYNLLNVYVGNNLISDVYANPIVALRYAATPGRVDGFSIKNNKFRNVLQSAIALTANNSTIEDNEFLDCETVLAGLGVISMGDASGTITLPCTNNVLKGNIFTSSLTTGSLAAAKGIVINPQCYSNVVWGNEFETRYFRTNIHNVGIGTRTEPINLLAPDGLLYTDANSRMARATIGANLTFSAGTLSGTGTGTGGGTLTRTNLQPVLVVVDGDSQSTTNYSGYGQAWSDFLKRKQPWTNFTITNMAVNARMASNNVLDFQSRGGAIGILTNLAPHSAVWMGWFGYADLISGHSNYIIINNLSNGMVMARKAGYLVVVPTIQQGGGSVYSTNDPPTVFTTNRWVVNNWLRTEARTSQLYDYLIDIETIFSNSIPQYSETKLGYAYDLFSTNYNPSADLTISDETHWNALAQSIVADHVASNVLRWATQPLGVHGGTIRGLTGLTIENLIGTGDHMAVRYDGLLMRTNITGVGGGGSVVTNANQFGASPTLTIATNAWLTNLNIRAASGGSGALTVNTNTLVVTNGNVGIGISDPQYPLDVFQSLDSFNAINLENLNAGTSAGSAVLLTTDGGAASFYRTSLGYSVANLADNMVFQEAGGGDFVFYQAGETVRIKNSGLVGIGTNSPSARLHVTGNNTSSNVFIFGVTNFPNLMTMTSIGGTGAVGISVSAPTNMFGLSVRGNTTLHSNVFLPNLRTNASPMALVGINEDGAVFETAAPAGGGTPGGNSGAIQFAQGSFFAGTNVFIYNRTNGTVQIFDISAGSALQVGGQGVFQAGDNVDLYLGVAAKTNAWFLEGNTGDVFMGSLIPGTSNRVSIGSSISTVSNVWANVGYFKESVNVAGPGNGKVAIADTNGTNFQFEAATDMDGSNVFYRLPKNATPGVMVAVPEVLGLTNQMTNITLTAGQTIGHDGTSYLAVSASGEGVMTQTNFVLNTLYTNTSTTLITVRTFLTEAAVNGVSSVELMWSPSGGAGWTNLATTAMSTLLTGIASQATNSMSAVLTNLGSFYFTNTSSGAGNSAGLVAGTGQRTTVGVGPAGPTGAVGPASLFTNAQMIAYVATNGNDSTAAIGVEQLPFLTVSNAIKAVRTNGGTVKIGPGRFLSPPAPLLISRLDSSAGTNLLVISGSGKPYPSGTNYLTLDAQNRTVLEGTLGINRPRVHVTNLGVDCGSNVCASLYGGTAVGALEFYTYNQEYYTTNTVNFDCAVRNVSVLCKDTNSAVHALLFENVLNGVLEDIDCWNGTHGLVIKGYRVSGNRIRCAGHISNGVIIKANAYAIPGYLPRDLPDFNGGNPDAVGCGMITLNNVLISHLRLTNDTAGLRIDGTPDAGNIAFIQVSGLVCNRVTYDVILNGGSATSIVGTRIDATSYTAPVIQKSGNLSAVYVNNAVQ